MEIESNMKTKFWRLCKICNNFHTSNKSQICDACLKEKYKLSDKITHKEYDHLGTENLVPLYFVLKILDDIESGDMK